MAAISDGTEALHELVHQIQDSAAEKSQHGRHGHSGGGGGGGGYEASGDEHFSRGSGGRSGPKHSKIRAT